MGLGRWVGWAVGCPPSICPSRRGEVAVGLAVTPVSHWSEWWPAGCSPAAGMINEAAQPPPAVLLSIMVPYLSRFEAALNLTPRSRILSPI